MNYLAAIILVLTILCYVHTTSCLTRKEERQFAAKVQLVRDGDMYRFFSSGLPDHERDDDLHPFETEVANYTYNITINPDNNVDRVWCTHLGPIGFAKNGVAIFNALTGRETDAVLYELFDDCDGHPSPRGDYHYHKFPPCVGSLMHEDEFLGIALDGNPIYGPNASDVISLLTSADLDACHGRFVRGRYRYHFTADFPYTIGCYKAEPSLRPTYEAVCSNTDCGSQICTCVSGTLTQCETLVGGNDGCAPTLPNKRCGRRRNKFRQGLWKRIQNTLG